MVSIRKMEPYEAEFVKKEARRTFGIVEQLFIDTPKEAMVAVLDDKIVGGILIKYIVSGDKKIGYYDGAFIAPEYHGQGIGSKLYKETTKYLWEQGCDALSALVKDDNVGSWKLFLNNEFSQVTIREAVHQLGMIPMLVHYFTTPFCISNGMEFYLASKTKEVAPKKVQTTTQIGWSLLANFLLMFIPALIIGRNNINAFMSAYMILIVGGVISGFIGTKITKRKWHYRANSAGVAIVAFINLMGVYPLISNWYPEIYENTKAFKKDMGIVALSQWLFTSIALIIANLINTGTLICNYFIQLGPIFLLYHLFIFYPFESFGGKRLYDWNKKLYIMIVILSIIMLIIQISNH